MSAEINHLAAISRDLVKTRKFYGDILELGVFNKRSSFTGPRVCHFYWHPEIENYLTFYHCPGLDQGHFGSESISAIGFSVHMSGLSFWTKRLKENRVVFRKATDPITGDPILSFADPDGLFLKLVFTLNDERKGERRGSVPDTYAIKGIYGIVISSHHFRELGNIIEHKFGLYRITQQQHIARYACANKPGSVIDIEPCPEERHGTSGYGRVHHVAFQFRNSTIFPGLVCSFNHNSDLFAVSIEKTHFSSFYFREGEGILIEIIQEKKNREVANKSTQRYKGLVIPKENYTF